MFQRFDHRGAHYLLLVIVWAILCLPNLGAPSLWDIDEGNNSTAARDMYESGDWVVPHFNNHLRFDKPALLYWLQLGAYQAFGVNEFAARLPSALATLLTVLVIYELGRRAFHARVGLLAGSIAASTVCFCAAAHFANPDALLDACTTLTLAVFFIAYRRGNGWWSAITGATTGLAVLAKGPVGLVLPCAVLVMFLIWERRLRQLGDWRALTGVLTFLVVAAPWYVWVALETKGIWVREFILNHNIFRFGRAMEGHGGPVWYYVLMLSLGFLPWSVFLGVTIWNAFAELRGKSVTPRTPQKRSVLRSIGTFFAPFVPRAADNPNQTAVRFLVCWFVVFFAFFTVSGTKLPNYILPLYPAVALLMARLLDRYRTGAVRIPTWSLRLSLVSLGLAGFGLAAGLLVVGGTVPLGIKRNHLLPGLELLAVAGALPLIGAVIAWRSVTNNRPAALLGVMGVTAVLFTGALAAWGPLLADRSKAPRELVKLLPADQTSRDVRVGTFDYFQPSLVFYCQREVEMLAGEGQVQDFLDGPLPSYLILPADRWAELEPRLHGRLHALGARYDLYEGRDVVVVGNAATTSDGAMAMDAAE